MIVNKGNMYDQYHNIVLFKVFNVIGNNGIHIFVSNLEYDY